MRMWHVKKRGKNIELFKLFQFLLQRGKGFWFLDKHKHASHMDKYKEIYGKKMFPY